MKTQSVSISADLLTLLGQSHLGTRPPAGQVTTAIAIYLFQAGIISVGKAAELADEPRFEFETRLVEMGIATVRYDLADYEEDRRAIAEAQRRDHVL